MSCEEMDILLGAYLDGELDAARRGEVLAHLPGCERCRSELEALQELKRSSRELAAPLVSGTEWDRCWHGIAREIQRPVPVAHAPIWQHVLAGAAAAVLLLALYMIVSGEQPTARQPSAGVREAAPSEVPAPVPPVAPAAMLAGVPDVEVELLETRDTYTPTVIYPVSQGEMMVIWVDEAIGPPPD